MAVQALYGGPCEGEKGRGKTDRGDGVGVGDRGVHCSGDGTTTQKDPPPVPSPSLREGGPDGVDFEVVFGLMLRRFGGVSNRVVPWHMRGGGDV